MALIKCVECGKEISDKVDNCIHCGCPLKINEELDLEYIKYLVQQEQTEQAIKELVEVGKWSYNDATQYVRELNPKSDDYFGLKVLGFFLPLVGFILYAVYYEKEKVKAKAIGIWSLFGCLVCIIFYIIYITSISSTLYYYY